MSTTTNNNNHTAMEEDDETQYLNPNDAIKLCAQALQTNNISQVHEGIKTLQALLSDRHTLVQQHHAQLIIATIPLGLLFNAFKYYDQDEEGEEIAAGTYSIVKQVLDLQDSSILNDSKIATYFTLGAKHPCVLARKLVIEQIARLLHKDQDATDLFTKQIDLANILVQGLKDAELSVAKQSERALLAFGKTEFGLKLLFENKNFSLEKTLKGFMFGKDIYKLRVLEMLVQLSNQSDLAFLYVSKTKLLDEIIVELQSDNILNLLNVLEIIKIFCESKQGLEYLQSKNAFSIILAVLVNNAQDAVISSFIQSFIGDLSESGDKTISLLQPDALFKTLFDSIDSEDAKSQEVAVTVVATIASNTTSGYQALLGNQQRLMKYLQILDSSDPTAIHHSLAQIFESKFHSSDALKALFKEIDVYFQQDSTSLIQRLMSSLNVPFLEQRTAIFHLMHALSRHIYGVQSLLASPLFVDFLVNRNTETTKQGKEWKYAIAQTMWETTHPKDNNKDAQVLDTKNQTRVLKFLKEGPFFVASEAAVDIATESTF